MIWKGQDTEMEKKTIIWTWRVKKQNCRENYDMEGQET